MTAVCASARCGSPSLRLGTGEGLPPLENVDLILWERHPGGSSAADHLAAHPPLGPGARLIPVSIPGVCRAAPQPGMTGPMAASMRLMRRSRALTKRK